MLIIIAAVITLLMPPFSLMALMPAAHSI